MVGSRVIASLQVLVNHGLLKCFATRNSLLAMSFKSAA